MHRISKLTLIGLLFGTALFILPLLNAWQGYFLPTVSLTKYSAMGGIIPWSDAGGYYTGAQNFIETGVLDEFNARRPLNALLFSIRLALSGMNFKIALLIQALLCGFICFYAASSVSKQFGKVSGFVTFIILFLFADTFLPTTLTESLGLTLGSLAFILLWQANQTRQITLITPGIFFLTVALNARAGAFLVIPLLILWFSIPSLRIGNFKKFQFRWDIFAFSISAVILAFVVNKLIIHLYGNAASSSMHSNFAPTLYGLVAGGKGWSYAYHFFTLPGSEAATATFLYKKSLEIFLQQPFLIFKGIFLSTLGLIKGLISFFQYQLPDSVLIKLFIRSLGSFALIFSIHRLFKLYRQAPNEIGFISISLVGMFLSASIIWTDGGYRVFAATIPFFASACGVVAGSVFAKRVDFKNEANSTNPLFNSYLALTLGTFLVLTSLVGPKFLLPSVPSMATKGIPQFSCNKGETLIVVRKIADSPYLILTPPAMQYNINLSNSGIESKQEFLELSKPFLLDKTLALGSVYDLDSNKSHFIMGDPSFFNSKAVLGLCGNPIQETGNLKVLRITSLASPTTKIPQE